MSLHQAHQKGSAILRNLSTVERPLDVEQLELLADWKSDIEARISRAQLRFMLVDVDHDFANLGQEVADFARVCRVLKWRASACT
jgi:hypothetical protein